MKMSIVLQNWRNFFFSTRNSWKLKCTFLVRCRFFFLVIWRPSFHIPGKCVCVQVNRADFSYTERIYSLNRMIAFLFCIANYLFATSNSWCQAYLNSTPRTSSSIDECEFMYVSQQTNLHFAKLFHSNRNGVHSTRRANSMYGPGYIEKFSLQYFDLCVECSDLVPKYKREKVVSIFRYKFWKKIEWMKIGWNGNHLVICVVGLG